MFWIKRTARPRVLFLNRPTRRKMMSKHKIWPQFNARAPFWKFFKNSYQKYHSKQYSCGFQSGATHLSKTFFLSGVSITRYTYVVRLQYLVVASFHLSCHCCPKAFRPQKSGTGQLLLEGENQSLQICGCYYSTHRHRCWLPNNKNMGTDQVTHANE